MTRHKHAQTGLVTPQLPQLLLTAVLRAFAMIVLNVASTLQMIRRRIRVNATRATPEDLPRAKTDTQHQETTPAVQQDSPIALILRDRMHHARTAEFSRAIVSKDGKGVLTNLTPSFLRKQEPKGYEGSACRLASRSTLRVVGNDDHWLEQPTHWKREPSSRVPGEGRDPAHFRKKRATRPSSEPLT